MPLTSQKTSPTEWSVMTQLMDAVTRSIAVMDVGIIVGVDTVHRTVDVQPLTQTKNEKNEYTKKGIRYATPYLEISGIRYPIRNGDKCIVIYADNNIDGAKNGANEPTPPLLEDPHGVNNGVAILGFHSKAEQASETTHLELTDDTEISLTAPAVKISTGASGTFISQDSKTITVEHGIITQIL